MLASGNVIDGRYELIRRLDRGSMGEVWVAHESNTRDVAIKFILSENQDPELVERFLGEVHTAAGLRSSHIVGVYHWGSHAGSPYMVMELLQGFNLADRLSSHGRFNDVRQAVDYTVQACEALVVAHARGVVHRDLKPANLFLDEPTRQIKVLDFGIAKATRALKQQRTSAGSYFGTLAYSSPEQLASAADVTPRSDIWSIGATLYELLAGVAAFPQPYPQILQAIQEAAPSSLQDFRPEISGQLMSVICRCLAKDPAERFPDVETLIVQLAPFGGSESQAIAERLHFAKAPRVDPTSTRTEPIPAFHSEDDLVEAVCAPRQTPDGRVRRVVFMLGAGFSMPAAKQRGVPGTEQIVERIRKRLTARQGAQLLQRLGNSSNKYQDAFDLLASSHSADVANAVIRSAVLEAYRGAATVPESALEQERKCAELEQRCDDWHMPEGVAHLGRIIAQGLESERQASGDGSHYRSFSRLHLTTNFDPLLAISTRKHGGSCWAYPVDRDFTIPEPGPGNCLIVHLHGRWDQGDTLHNDLALRREQLERSLGEHLERSVLVVLGYGGWDDVFTRTLKQVARNRNTLDVLWGFFSNDPREILKQQGELVSNLRRLGPRIQFYRGVDTNRFFRSLAVRLEEASRASQGTARPVVTESSSVGPSAASTTRRSAAWLPMAVAGATLGLAAAWWSRSSNPAPPISPVPAAPFDAAHVPPEPPQLQIRCDSPVPTQGSIRVGAVTIPVARFCTGAGPAADAHTQALLTEFPALETAKEAEFEPPHLFYSLAIDRASRPAEWRLTRKNRAPITLQLTGDDCSRITLASVVVKPGLEVSWKPGPPSTDNRVDGKTTCDAQVELPFEAFGRSLHFVLVPGSYKADSVLFDGGRVQTLVTRVAPAVRAAPEREPKHATLMSSPAPLPPSPAPPALTVTPPPPGMERKALDPPVRTELTASSPLPEPPRPRPSHMDLTPPKPNAPSEPARGAPSRTTLCCSLGMRCCTQ